MKFAHISDVHIGSWRDPKLKEASTDAFVRAVDICIEKNVDFVLISGDLFNTSLPTVERLKIVVITLKKLKRNNIPVYIIAGSHDFSPSGKTMLDVLEKAELFKNVVKGDIADGTLKLQFTIDEKTGAKITGMLGKKGMLDKKYYEKLDLQHLETEKGFKIFMYHTAITEFKPTDMELMDSVPLSLFPKHFTYYAGGHVHYIYEEEVKGYGKFVYPGALFPNNFKELEKFKHGGFYLYEDEKTNYIPIELFKVLSFIINCNMKTPEETRQTILEHIKDENLHNTIITLRLKGTLLSGKIRDIGLKDIANELYEKGAYFVMKNTVKLTTKEFEEIKIDPETTDKIEQRIIQEHSGKISIEDMNHDKEIEITNKLLDLLNTEKKEGERTIDYEERIEKEFNDGLLLDLL